MTSRGPAEPRTPPEMRRGPGSLRGLAAYVCWRSVLAEDRQDAQQVGVDPDQADGQAEGGPPRLALVQAGGDALLDEVEVEQQHEHTEHQADDRHDQAE